MANETNKYAGLEALQTFLNNLKNLFATQETVEELSSNVAYISVEDNETVTETENEIITDDELNDLLTALEEEA